MSAMQDPLKCGDCGGDTFWMQNVKHPNAHRIGGHASGEVAGYIVVICCKCTGKSIITVTPAQLKVDGHLCGGWR